MSGILDLSYQAVVRRSDGQVSSEIDGESVILNLNNGMYYGLDPVGTRIWDLINEPKTVEQIQEVLMKEYEVEPEVCFSDLTALLRELADQGLVEVTNEMAC